MNPLMRLTGFTQGSVASGPTSFPNFLRTQAKLAQALADDLIPSAVNWTDINSDGVVPGNNSAQLLGINDAMGIRVTWTPDSGVFFAKTSASAMAADDRTTNPAGWSRILNGGVIFAANNSHVGIATAESGITISMRNADNANQLLDTFTCFALGGE